MRTRHRHDCAPRGRRVRCRAGRHHSQPTEAALLASRLVDVISAPYDLDDQRVVIGASVGVSIAPVDSSDPDQLMKNADMALYRAKADGRGTYRFFEPEMDARAKARRLL